MLAMLIARRIVLALITLLLVSAMLFGAIEVLPGDVASRLLGREATPELLASLRARMHLDDPPVTRYIQWLGNMVWHGDLGRSLVSDRPISEIVAPKIANTLILAAFALLLYLPLALIPACIQALNRERPVDHWLSVATLVFLSIPDFLLGTILMIVFVITVPWFPAVSTIRDSTTGLQFLRAITLPGTTLAIVMAVYAVRMLRDNLIEVLTSDYVRMAQLKGLPRYAVLLRHALPNALVPTLNITALNLAYVVGGVVIVEKLFSFPGFGSLLVNSVQLQDLPVIEATVMIAAVVYVGANLLADLAALLLNPRLRAGLRR